eukprot:gene3600-6335_t
MKIPGMVSLAGGVPNPLTFPFESCSFKLKDGSDIELSTKKLNEALQYTQTIGLPEFHSWVIEHQKKEFSPKLDSKLWNSIVTSGSQDGLSKAFESLIDEGDAILLENPTYSGSLAALRPLGPGNLYYLILKKEIEIISIETDHQGIIPEHLSNVLLERKKNSKPMPKFLYTIPHSSNPSGATIPDSRKEIIYKIASKYNFLILEDDPYYYLTYGSKLSSFLKFDEDGRVLRFDSLSKVLSSGLRLGWCTGPNEIIERINFHTQATSLHTPALTQAIAFELFKSWGEEGWNKHISNIQKFYKERKEVFCKLADKYLTGLAEWSVPEGGMFLWIKLENVEDSKFLIENGARDKLILLVPGQSFHPLNKPGPYVRAAFSIESSENFELGLKRFSELLKEMKSK